MLVTQCPTFTLFLLAVGGFSVARLALKTLFVLLQTFVVSGKSVRVTIRCANSEVLTPSEQLKKYGAGKGAWAGA